MHSVPFANDIDALKAALAEKDQVIESLRFEIARLKRLIFGARSERLEAVLDGEQLPLLEEMPEDAPLATPIQFKAAPAASNKGQPNTRRAAGGHDLGAALEARIPHRHDDLP